MSIAFEFNPGIWSCKSLLEDKQKESQPKKEVLFPQGTYILTWITNF
jgi:hypothetical protein